MNTNAYELRTDLNVAARAAYTNGATTAQIDMIVALARGADDFNVLSGSHLTKREASRIIDQMVSEGVEADWTASTDELEAQITDHRAASAQAAARKAKKAQQKAEKAERQAADLAAAVEAAGDEARRVSHVKFGLGTVLSEDDKAVTVLFDSQKKPLRMAPDFLTNA